jgi:hypothetical protein
MSERFRKRFNRISTIRDQWWDYSRGFDDEVIQSREEYFRIARYIRDNPTKWEE